MDQLLSLGLPLPWRTLSLPRVSCPAFDFAQSETPGAADPVSGEAAVLGEPPRQSPGADRQKMTHHTTINELFPAIQVRRLRGSTCLCGEGVGATIARMGGAPVGLGLHRAIGGAWESAGILVAAVFVPSYGRHVRAAPASLISCFYCLASGLCGTRCGPAPPRSAGKVNRTVAVPQYPAASRTWCTSWPPSSATTTSSSATSYSFIHGCPDRPLRLNILGGSPVASVRGWQPDVG